MPDELPTDDQFWVLTGAGPSGPFTVTQIRQMFATGEVTSGSKVCPLGGAGWSPLHRTPGLVPTTPAASSPLPQPATRPAPPPPSVDEDRRTVTRDPATATTSSPPSRSRRSI